MLTYSTEYAILIMSAKVYHQVCPRDTLKMEGIMKKYLIYWHVKDNPVTYPHNDNMLIYAKSADEAEKKAWNRIRKSSQPTKEGLS